MVFPGGVLGFRVGSEPDEEDLFYLFIFFFGGGGGSL